MLVLFDIDGTLLTSERAGIKAMTTALEEMHPGLTISFDGVEVAGRLDHLIWKDVARKNGFDASDDRHRTFREVYGRHLSERLRDNPTARTLAGVIPLVLRLKDEPGIHLGALTGNYEHTGRLKIRAAGLDPDIFRISAWADDGATRRHLPPIAMTRYHQRLGAPVKPHRIIIIGDTPLDVDCARHNGCSSIAVATGNFSVPVLRAAGADLAVETLEPTEMIVEWIRTRPQ